MKQLLSMILVMTLFSGGCIAGVQFPQADARRYLQKQGMSEAEARRITDLTPLTQKEYVKYSTHGNSDVRYSIALNPHAPKEILMQLTTDCRVIVRRGLASNKGIPEDAVAVLRKDTKRVLQDLVGNPAVSEEVILDIFDNENIDLYWFAFNPNCPERIRNYIRMHGSSLDKRVLSEYYREKRVLWQ